MEQPRFGGVASPPLSTSDGEGKFPESVTNTMDSTRPSMQDLHLQNTNNARSEAGDTDPDVQKVMEVLHQLGIFPCLEQHRLKDERRQETDRDDGVYCKNLLLKDKKGQAYLILCAEDDTANLQVVKYHLNAQGNLHFASSNSLWSLLRVHPGAVSPLALINSHGEVRVFIDASLKKRIDQDSTMLYFHPLKAELQVGLTLSQLGKFLHHCNTTLEILPSLVSYSARRQYSNLTGGHRFKHKSNPKLQEHHFESKREESGMAGMQDERPENKQSLEQKTEQQEKMKQANDRFQQCTDLCQQLGVSVDVVPVPHSQPASSYTILPCKSLYLKDKRNNYFLFICHENQKIDFSSLKAQLKPKKKIEPLDKDELWSLLHLSENQEHPFALVQLEHPKFVVAISDNLQYKGKAVLTFPHPADPNLHLEITLKDLETLITNTSHDLITIQMKGDIDELQGASISPTSSLQPKPAPLDEITTPSDIEKNHTHSALHHEEIDCQLDHSQAKVMQRGHHFQHRSDPELQENHTVSKREEDNMADKQEVGLEESGDTLDQEAEQQEKTKQTSDTFEQCTDLFQQLGISVDVVPVLHSQHASNYIILPCKSLYLKDKRNNYFLFICHENQKIDFSSLKAQLKPRKKIEPLDKDELWSLLHLSENQEHPFTLVQLEHPKFVVAISDNLQYKGKAVLTFPHPADPSLRLEITLKDLETLITSTSHDLITIQMKGDIDELQGASISPTSSLHSKPDPLAKMTQSSEIEKNNTHSALHHEENDCQLDHSEVKVMQSGHHFQHRSDPELQENHTVSKREEDDMAGVQEVELEELGDTLDQEAEQEKMKQAIERFEQCIDLCQQLGISVDVVPVPHSQPASSYTILPCKSLYLKDKRNNYFLFICHENQKIDFSSLKAQLKPRKKIEPLNKDELWSLLHLSENQEHPFTLVQLEHPKFVVTISDNLQYKGKAVLTFPHPADPNLRLEITLKDLETLITNTSHDLMTVQMKGNIEDMQANSTSCISSTHPKQAPHDHKGMHPSKVENGQLYHSDHKMMPAYFTERQSNNLFYQLTAPLRDWVLRCIRGLVKFLSSYLPSRILMMLRKSSFWRRIEGPESRTAHDCYKQNEDWTYANEEQTNGWTNKDTDKTAKIAKLQQLVAQCEIQVDLRDFQPTEKILKGNQEQCKTYLLENDIGQLIVVFCTEEDKPTRRNLRHLRTAFRFRSPLHLASDARMLHSLAWPENNLMSWTSEDLNPMALMDMNLRALGRVRVGMTGAVYSFSDTTLSFELPSLGVTLQMKSEDLEKMVKDLGFCIVYLP